jgi:hypothetical protein
MLFCLVEISTVLLDACLQLVLAHIPQAIHTIARLFDEGELAEAGVRIPINFHSFDNKMVQNVGYDRFLLPKHSKLHIV